MRSIARYDFHNQPSRFTARRLFVSRGLRLFEIALVLVRFNHIGRCIVNANHSITVHSKIGRCYLERKRDKL
jgi:hypothetical protein